MIWAVVLVAVATLAALPFLAEWLRTPVTKARHDTTDGFAATSDGQTRYRWSGIEGKPVMVLIHGLTGPSFLWDGLAPLLAANGARVLSYDLYGRGLSDRPRTAQTRDFFIRQLHDLLQSQRVEGEVTLIGYSMGGAIATVFATTAPDRVARLILIAPSGLARNARTAAELCRRIPGLGDWAMTVFGGIALRQEPVAEPSSVPDLKARLAGEPRIRGNLRSILSSMRNLLVERLDEEHALVSERNLPVLAIWGEVDQTIPLHATDELAEINPDARQVMIADADHGLIHTHPAEINQAIQAFLREE